ncbi:MAG: hypothetical protein ACQER6_04445 [Pseudomonadota bacterium]
MNESPHGVRGKETQKPQDNKNNRNGLEHFSAPPSMISRIANPAIRVNLAIQQGHDPKIDHGWICWDERKWAALPGVHSGPDSAETILRHRIVGHLAKPP